MYMNHITQPSSFVALSMRYALPLASALIVSCSGDFTALPHASSIATNQAGNVETTPEPTSQISPVEAVSPSPEQLARGANAFERGMCAKCHHEDGKGGKRAPDLTDAEWLHCDGTITGILQVLHTGVSKDCLKDPTRPFAMNPVKNLVPNEQDLNALAAYVWSLSHPAD